MKYERSLVRPEDNFIVAHAKGLAAAIFVFFACIFALGVCAIVLPLVAVLVPILCVVYPYCITITTE